MSGEIVDSTLNPTLIVMCARNYSKRAEILAASLVMIADQSATGNRVLILVSQNKTSEQRVPVGAEMLYEGELGFASIRNKALALRKSNENLLFVDGDDTVTDSWLVSFQEAVRKFPSSILISGVAKVDENGQEIVDIWNRKRASLKLGYEVAFGNAGNMFIPVGVFNARTVYFDPYFNSGGEGTDLVLRMKSQGINSVWVPGAMIYQYTPSIRLSRNWENKRRLYGEKVFSISGRRNLSFGWVLGRFLLLSSSFILRSIIGVLSKSQREKSQISLEALRSLIRPIPIDQRFFL